MLLQPSVCIDNISDKDYLGNKGKKQESTFWKGPDNEYLNTMLVQIRRARFESPAGPASLLIYFIGPLVTRIYRGVVFYLFVYLYIPCCTAKNVQGIETKSRLKLLSEIRFIFVQWLQSSY